MPPAGFGSAVGQDIAAHTVQHAIFLLAGTTIVRITLAGRLAVKSGSLKYLISFLEFLYFPNFNVFRQHSR